MRAAPRRPRFRIRAGFTVVEVLVALVIVSVGLLGMAGTATLSLRTAAAASRERRALGRLRLRLATLAASGCGATSGSAADPVDAMQEQWAVGLERGGAVLVDASVEWSEGAGTRTLTARSAILCR